MKIRFNFLIVFMASASLFAGDVKDEAARLAQKLDKPISLQAFNSIRHLPPINQDTTSSCWSFSTLSFLESEMLRQGHDSLRLAMMYPVYWGFVEKAGRYVKTHGRSRFAAGDLFTGVLDIVKKYGIVPQSVYAGQTRSCKTFNHDPLYADLQKYLAEVKETGNWNATEVLEQVRKILDKYLGRPPVSFLYRGKSYTPKSFLKNVTGLQIGDYRMFTSFLYAPFGQKIILDVPDNWARQKIYYNLPLRAFYNTLKRALQKGYGVAIDADVSEPGRVPAADVCFIPPFDMADKDVSPWAREFRFKNGSTTDDHLMHIVGFAHYGGHDWFLTKDSWRTAWDGRYKGYFFLRDDYVKLKILAFVVHKDAIK